MTEPATSPEPAVPAPRPAAPAAPATAAPATAAPATAAPATAAPATAGPAAPPAGVEPAPAAATTAPGPLAKTTNIVAGPGGVMTVDVGVITGDVTVRTELEGEKLTVRVQYLEADEWYVLQGGEATLKDPADLDAVHTIVVAILNRPEG